jgi:hypothetical protein
LAAQGHLPNDFLLAGELSLAFGDVPISFCEVITLHVCHRQSASRRSAGASKPQLICPVLNAGEMFVTASAQRGGPMQQGARQHSPSSTSPMLRRH